MTGLWVITPELPATNLSSSYQLHQRAQRDQRGHMRSKMPRCRCVWVGSKNKNHYLFISRSFPGNAALCFHRDRNFLHSFSFPHGDYDDVCFRAIATISPPHLKSPKSSPPRAAPLSVATAVSRRAATAARSASAAPRRIVSTRPSPSAPPPPPPGDRCDVYGRLPNESGAARCKRKRCKPLLIRIPI